jgi:glycosyltransferase involved in cell wall biosynthesis
MAVGRKETGDSDVYEIPNEQARLLWSRALRQAAHSLHAVGNRLPGNSLMVSMLTAAADPLRYLDIYRGLEDFNFPGTQRILELTPDKPDIVHCHNLHGGYFDLRALPWLSRQLPVALTLHDTWMLSGHCAYSIDCDRWKSGCGQCPYLTIYPAIRREATAYNWLRKQDIYSRSHLYVATPSRWLLEEVKQSMLAPALADGRVIHNGVDLSHFKPVGMEEARYRLGLPTDSKIVLFVGQGTRRNLFKDYETMERALTRLAPEYPDRLLFVCLGEERKNERLGGIEIRFIEYQSKLDMVASYYQAADLYLHAARADTFPNVVLEALACGTPVVATAIGGIPEQIEDGVTGFLTPPGDSEAMAARTAQLLRDADMRRRFAENAADSARRRFDLKKQVDAYLAWYNDITERWKHNLAAARS